MATAKLTTLTPVHVGSGQKLLRDFDFIVQGSSIGMLDLEKIVTKIGIERLPQLTAEIEKKAVGGFLKKTLANLSLTEVCSRTVKTNGHISATTGELKEQYRTALQGPCIPGSSLKGSLRTALVKYLTAEEQNNDAKQRELLRLVNWDESRRVNFGKLDEHLLGKTANVKSTRFLTVGDVQFAPEDAEVHELSYVNLRGNGWAYETGKAQLVECVRAGATASFQLKLNLALAEKYRQKRASLLARNPEDKTMAPLKDLSFFDAGEPGFLNNLAKQTIAVLEWDVQKLRDLDAEADLLDTLSDLLRKATACKEGEAVVRVGGHNGWHFMTGRWMVYDEQVFTDRMFDTMQQAAQRTNRYLGTDLPFPKTRKMTDAGLPLGFVKIGLL